MNFSLKPDYEQFIQQELETGRYANAEEVIATALELLKQQSQYEQWAKEVGQKIDIAAAELDRGEGIDGEIAIARLKERLHQRKM